MSEENAVDRRKLLRRAGTVAAGVGAAGVASAIAASPASAAAGEALVQGSNETAGVANSINSTASSTLTLSNSGSGAPLTLPAKAWPSGLADGSIVFDSGQGLNYAWGGNGSQAAVYDSSWVPIVVPTPPLRVLVTFTSPAQMGLASGYSMSGGKINPKNSATVPDMLVDLSWALDPATDLSGTAVQFNLTAFSAAAGWVAAWDEGPWPSNSNINTPGNNTAIANFCQVAVGSDGKIRFKMNRPTALIIDILGFVAWPGNFTTGDAAAKAPAAAQKVTKTLAGIRNSAKLPRR
ncbi:hypothetical protein AB0M47_11140 [Hamadaea sp. NPDC051192]|uniref:hypothetical protein n=1 Tax=Hamadaea sp. NPDC051192 TaxID=3154940 RepID=UPI0034208539